MLSYIVAGEHAYRAEIAAVGPGAAAAACAVAAGRHVPPNFSEQPDGSVAAVKAYVNHGRWLVGCPRCNSAQYATLSDPRFWCALCGYGWAAVTFPEELQLIEATLMARPSPLNRNFDPEFETARTLHGETLAHLNPGGD